MGRHRWVAHHRRGQRSGERDGVRTQKDKKLVRCTHRLEKVGWDWVNGKECLGNEISEPENENWGPGS